MSDQQITCSECGDAFVFTAAEQGFYTEKGLASPPKRCKPCRQARKASRGPASGGGAPRRFSNDVNEYRSPMSGGVMESGYNRGAGYSRGDRARGGAGGGAGGYQGRSNGSPSGDRNGNRAGGGGFRGNGQHTQPRPHETQGNGASEYRSPAFPDARPSGPRARGPNEGPSSARGNGERRNDRPPPRAPRGDAPPPGPRPPRPERPKFDITCAECGTGAQVPFKPLEGRQVFCQDCYRARRGTVKDSAGATDVPETDTGIVE